MSVGKAMAATMVLGAVKLFAKLPLRVSQTIGKLIGWIMWRMDVRGTRVARENIALCLPQLSVDAREQLVRASMLHTGQMILETPAAWLGRPDKIDGWIREVENEQLLLDAIAAPEGVVIMLPHIGNWEMFNVYIALRVGPCTALYAPPRQDYLKPLMQTVRSQFGNELVPTNRQGITALFRRLKEGKCVIVLPDQVPATGEFAPFFGQRAFTDALVTRLIAKTGARAVCCVVQRLPDAAGFKLVVTDAHADIYAKDPATAMKGMNQSVEACVLSVPAQNQWEYKRFKMRPKGDRRLYGDAVKLGEFH